MRPLAGHAGHAGHGAAHAGEAAALGWLPAAAVLVAAVVGYLALVRACRRRTGRAWDARRTASWVVGAALVAAALAPPVAGHAADPRGHMAQHLLLGMLAPVALVLAAPVTLVLGASSGAARRRLGALLASAPVRVLTHPATAAVLHVGGLAALYLTGLGDAAARVPALQAAVLAHFVLAGALFAWSVAGPDPVRHRPGLPTRAAALVLAGGAHAVLAKHLYALAAGDAAAEQAAVLMYYGGDVAEVLLAVALGAGWYRGRVLAGRRRAALPTVVA